MAAQGERWLRIVGEGELAGRKSRSGSAHSETANRDVFQFRWFGLWRRASEFGRLRLPSFMRGKRARVNQQRK